MQPRKVDPLAKKCDKSLQASANTPFEARGLLSGTIIRGTSSSLLDTLAHCYTPYCTPGPSPYAYKRKVQGSRTRRLAARENGSTHKALALSLSHANACNPLLQAHPAALGTGQHEGRGFPLLFSPLCVPSRVDPSGLGHTATIYSSVQGPPGVETPTNANFRNVLSLILANNYLSMAK
jgi:hypothetical protein